MPVQEVQECVEGDVVMTYYEHYLTAHEECDLIAMMKHDTKCAIIFGNNPDRIKAIEDAGNKVAREKGWNRRAKDE